MLPNFRFWIHVGKAILQRQFFFIAREEASLCAPLFFYTVSYRAVFFFNLCFNDPYWVPLGTFSLLKANRCQLVDLGINMIVMKTVQWPSQVFHRPKWAAKKNWVVWQKFISYFSIWCKNFISSLDNLLMKLAETFQKGRVKLLYANEGRRNFFETVRTLSTLKWFVKVA